MITTIIIITIEIILHDDDKEEENLTYLGTNILSPSFNKTLKAISTAPEHPDVITTSSSVIFTPYRY
jgi:hypothetical protein